MDENYDPSRDPDMVSHYVGGAINKGQYYALTQSSKLEPNRKNILKRLNDFDLEKGCPESSIVKELISFLDEHGEWKTEEDVSNFAKKYHKLIRQKIILR